MSTAEPSDHEVLLDAIRGQLAQLHTALPATVVDYDEATQTATVRPVFKFAFRDADTGEVKRYAPPSIARVPVAFPGAGDFSITWPLAPGDGVLLVFSERSIDEWRAVVGSSHEPADLRRFDLSDAIAIPALRSPAAPVPIEGYAAGALVMRAPEVRLGSSTASDYLALSSLVLTELNRLWTAMWSHVHGGVTTGGGTSATAVGSDTANSVAATKVKAE